MKRLGSPIPTDHHLNVPHMLVSHCHSHGHQLGFLVGVEGLFQRDRSMIDCVPLAHWFVLPLFDDVSIAHLKWFVNTFKKFFLAVGKSHVTPPQDADLVASLANGHGFALRADSVALVHIIDPFAVPHAAVATIRLDSLDALTSTLALYAFCGYLPTALVGDRLACFKRQPVVVGQLVDAPDVDHCGGLLALSLYAVSIAHLREAVKCFLRYFVNLSKHRRRSLLRSSDHGTG